jgi:CRP/FNR family transcriptional regulator
VLDIIQPGGFDGLLALLGQRGHFTEAAEPSVVASLDWSLFERFLEADPSIVRNLVQLVGERLERREEHLQSMVIRDPTRRLARQLSALAVAIGQLEVDGRFTIPRSVTHQVLADMLGIRRETVTLHLHRLAETGALDIQGRQLTVSRSKLEAIAQQEDD